jgi:D-xylose transport system substrate-binding protein
MSKRNNIKCIGLLMITFMFFLLYGCKPEIENVSVIDKEKVNDIIKIGFSMGTLQEERWQRDRDIFVARAKELGADVIVQNANNDNEEQMKQVKYLIEQGIDILVIVPHDAERSGEIVQMAKKAGIKVISYDRLVKNAKADLYISFDNVKVGELMAQALLKKVPAGNYIILNGAETDNNSYMFRKGYVDTLESHVASGKIKIVSEIWAKDWAHEDAFQCVEKALEQGKVIDAIIGANDNLASAAIEALSEKRLAGKVSVVGHDADLAACQRVVEGTQLMTVYKPIDKIAKAAAEIAIKMAKGEAIAVNSTIFDGKYQIPFYMIEPIPVTIDNMKDTVIHDSFHRLEDIYINVPKSNWPVD